MFGLINWISYCYRLTLTGLIPTDGYQLSLNWVYNYGSNVKDYGLVVMDSQNNEVIGSMESPATSLSKSYQFTPVSSTYSFDIGVGIDGDARGLGASASGQFYLSPTSLNHYTEITHYNELMYLMLQASKFLNRIYSIVLLYNLIPHLLPLLHYKLVRME